MSLNTSVPASAAVDEFLDALLDPLQNFDPVSLEDVRMCIATGDLSGEDGERMSVEYPPRACGALLKHAQGRCLAHQMVASARWPLRHVNCAHLEQMDPLVIQRAIGTTDGDIAYCARVMSKEWIAHHWPCARFGARWFLTMLEDEHCFLSVEILLTRGLWCTEIRNALHRLYATPSLSERDHFRLCSLPSKHNPRPAHIVAQAQARHRDISCEPAMRRVAALAIGAHMDAHGLDFNTQVDASHGPGAADAWFEDVYAPKDNNDPTVCNGLYNPVFSDVYDSLIDGVTAAVADTPQEQPQQREACVGTKREWRDPNGAARPILPYANDVRDELHDSLPDGAPSVADIQQLPEKNVVSETSEDDRENATFEELLRATRAWRIDCH
eukprot:GEMP01054747.1.p1 GENE.GEMP01054747.1~~GEMP01054747.1.p1  ORF type:complete len:384 (+),score=97.00 GEMP01054747.1:117-1268(+)